MVKDHSDSEKGNLLPPQHTLHHNTSFTMSERSTSELVSKLLVNYLLFHCLSIYLFIHLLIFMTLFQNLKYKLGISISSFVRSSSYLSFRNCWGGGAVGGRLNYFRAHIHRRFKHAHHETRDWHPGLGSRDKFS